MNIENILVTVAGVFLVILIYWFFFGKKEEESIVGDKVSIKVAGGYSPSIIKVTKGNKIIFSIKRTEDNPCLEEFVLPDFKIKKFLPLNETVDIEIDPQKTGEFVFHCGMNMFHGKVLVV